MRRVRIFIVLGILLITDMALGAQIKGVDAARPFIPPNARLAELYKVYPETGKVIERTPAIIAGHILSPKSEDIVLAYFVPDSPPDYDKTLFIAVLHRTESGFVKLWEQTYYGRVLLVPEAVRLIKLGDGAGDSVAVITGMGASLGGQLQVFRWDPAWGLVNVMPQNDGVHKVSFGTDKGMARISLSFQKYPGDPDARLPIVYRWDGKIFVEAQHSPNHPACPSCPD